MKKLRPLFHLVDYPNHDADWRKIEAHFESKTGLIQGNLGAELELNRKEVEQLDFAASLNVLVGASGSPLSGIAGQNMHLDAGGW